MPCTTLFMGGGYRPVFSGPIDTFATTDTSSRAVSFITIMLYPQQPSSSISNCTSTALGSVLTRRIRIGYFFCAALIFAQRAFCAALILAMPAAEIFGLRLIAGADVP